MRLQRIPVAPDRLNRGLTTLVILKRGVTDVLDLL
jgi:hypothetical protein